VVLRAPASTNAAVPSGPPGKLRKVTPDGPGMVTAASAGLQLGFSTKTQGELSPNRFTGPAVKPLPVLR
jgi:hypothetical protein